MKRTTYLTAALLLLTAAPVQAIDITSPFYLPRTGQIVSTTAAEYNHKQVKSDSQNYHARDRVLSQNIEYGVAPRVSVEAQIQNAWNRTKGTITDIGYENGREDTNVDWRIGTKYNIVNTGFSFAQLGLGYGQKETHHMNGAYKYVDFGAKIGQDLGIVMPYAGIGVEFPVAQSKESDNNMKYEGYIGLHHYLYNFLSLDAALNLNYDEMYEAREWRTDLAADYFLSPYSTIGVYGSYVIDDSGKWDSRAYEHQIGIRFKTVF